MVKKKIKAIILASGSGGRFKKEVPKQFLELKGCPLIIYSLIPFQKCNKIDEIVIVILKGYIDKTWKLIDYYKITKVKKIISGGKLRQESSRIGVEVCGEDTDYVLIHDAVRPIITDDLLNEIVKALKNHDAVVPIIPTSDTIVEIDTKGFIKKPPNRVNLSRVQTPQGFKYELIKQAHEQALKDGLTNSTDDSFLVSRMGYPVLTLRGDERNIKITFPLDFDIAGNLLKK
ncbi:2-C-methyl-D-erythritol 4-phosphate cytidylyltransferase [Desulfobacterota bacterium AH_259_B03_O07]|nr:2-C-methyl-D-erythritol 4-phosphate cytidylyltransferase [Desulfobacterota bacterium AH_259_B03_O07]